MIAFMSSIYNIFMVISTVMIVSPPPNKPPSFFSFSFSVFRTTRLCTTVQDENYALFLDQHMGFMSYRIFRESWQMPVPAIAIFTLKRFQFFCNPESKIFNKKTSADILNLDKNQEVTQRKEIFLGKKQYVQTISQVHSFSVLDLNQKRMFLAKGFKWTTENIYTWLLPH